MPSVKTRNACSGVALTVTVLQTGATGLGVAEALAVEVVCGAVGAGAGMFGGVIVSPEGRVFGRWTLLGVFNLALECVERGAPELIEVVAE